MKFFMLESNVLSVAGKTPEEIQDAVNAHIAYIDEAFETGCILVTGKKAAIKGGNITIMKAKTMEEVKQYCEHDPLRKFGMIEYSIAEFLPRLYMKDAPLWVKEP